MPLIISLLAVYQRRPIKLRPADADAMNVRLANFVKRVARGNQHLLGRAATVWAGTAEIALLDERHLQPRLAGRYRDAKARVAAAEDQQVVAVASHVLTSTRGNARPSKCQATMIAIVTAERHA